MKRLVLSTVFSLFAVLALAHPVGADYIWCEKDPIVLVNGSLVQILVAIPQEYEPLVNGPTDIRIITPNDAVRRMVYMDPGFNGYGETISWGNSGSIAQGNRIPLEIEVKVPVTKTLLTSGQSVPVRVTVIPSSGPQAVAFGTSDFTEVQLTIMGQ